MTDALRVETAAHSDYASARNCAESVLRALQAEIEIPAVSESAGSGFTSGIGDSGCVCGALAGAVMVVGAHAETVGLMPEARRLYAEKLSAAVHDRFKERWGSTCCRVISRHTVSGSSERLSRCAEITAQTAGIVLEVIEEARCASPPRFGVRDVTGVAERLSIGLLAGVALGVVPALLLPTDGAGAAPVFALVAAAVGTIVAVVGERARSAERTARVLRAVGLVASAVALLLVLGGAGGGPQVAFARMLAGGAGGLLGWLVGVATLILGGIRGYELVRYR